MLFLLHELAKCGLSIRSIELKLRAMTVVSLTELVEALAESTGGQRAYRRPPFKTSNILAPARRSKDFRLTLSVNRVDPIHKSP